MNIWCDARCIEYQVDEMAISEDVRFGVAAEAVITHSNFKNLAAEPWANTKEQSQTAVLQSGLVESYTSRLCPVL